jgi:hypothetical protein
LAAGLTLNPFLAGAIVGGTTEGLNILSGIDPCGGLKDIGEATALGGVLGGLGGSAGRAFGESYAGSALFSDAGEAIVGLHEAAGTVAGAVGANDVILYGSLFEEQVSP